MQMLLACPPAALVVEGGPRTGKSALWAEAVAAARRAGATVLTATGFPSEAGLAWTGLGDLLDGLDDGWFDVLPPAQRVALDTVLLRRDGGPRTGGAIDRTVAVAVLHLLRGVAAHGPLLLAIDDAQWTDDETRNAVAFALRRLPEVHVLVTRHDGPAGRSALLDGVPHARRLTLPPREGSPAAGTGPAGLPPGGPPPRRLTVVGDVPVGDGPAGDSPDRDAPGRDTPAGPVPLLGLTCGERRVVELVTRGASNRETAQALHVSVRTVEGHLSAAYRKLGLRTRTELAVLVLRAPDRPDPPRPPVAPTG